ncbi:signal peptidase I [Streptomyces sp. JJ66]|uniref:signal peptidase I n=1 Tax=Streptomyces sp. JJ66 TaxID=2803843 RepID=UPI001C56F8E4|nr:signal peptidase I [Streptomyces sp. JJ66]MBW1601265.1 signal peptidase I [Streptomyces sp. JJ66]
MTDISRTTAARRAALRTGRYLRARGRRTALWAGAVVIALALVSVFVVQPYVVASGSMENTLRAGDRVLVNKLAYRFGNEPRRGDVVVFDGTGTFAPQGKRENPLTRFLRTTGAALGVTDPPGSDYVKRVVGIGGDRVTCCDEQGRIEVNGRPLAEEYLHPEGGAQRASSVDFDTIVPEGRLWVMGDHRAVSSDSRDHLGSPGGGTVATGDVIGRVEWTGWPPARWTVLRNGHG